MIKRLLSLFSLTLLVLLLTACGGAATSSTNDSPIDTPITGNTSKAASITWATGNFREYALPQSNSGMMRPAMDHEGRLWFGEMGHNYLAVFDPHTQTFQQMTPPRGADGIMGIAVAPDNTIWFAEQYANYIGHYFPSTRQYQVYNLPTLTVPDPSNKNNTLSLPSAPNDLALDAHGNVWFTEMNADSLGMLDARTGLFKHYALSSKKSVQTLNPYGVTVDPQGMVWFTESSTDKVGRLDSGTGDIRFFTMQGPANPLMEIASDTHGIIWITSFTGGLLLRLEPSTGVFTSYYAPSTGNGASGLYGLTITSSNEVWVTVPGENAVARLDVGTQHFLYYHIPTAASLPLGVVMGTGHTLWFTEAGSNKIGMLTP